MEIKEEVIRYDPNERLSYDEGGEWPHLNHYGFHEAVVAAHFRRKGYIALHDYNCSYDYTSEEKSSVRPIREYFTKLFHEIVKPQISEFMKTELKQTLGTDYGQPDLFVFQAFNFKDPKISYSDLPWFFVEVKGPNETIRDTQLRYWRLIANRRDLGLGEERIRLFRAIPIGMKYEAHTFEY